MLDLVGCALEYVLAPWDQFIWMVTHVVGRIEEPLVLPQ